MVCAAGRCRNGCTSAVRANRLCPTLTCRRGYRWAKGQRGPSGRPFVLCWETRWPQGMRRRLLSDLAVLVEGSISASYRLCQPRRLGLAALTGLVWIFRSWGSTPTSHPASDSIEVVAEGAQKGRWAVPGSFGSDWANLQAFGVHLPLPSPWWEKGGAEGLLFPWNSHRIQRVAPSPHRAEGRGCKEITNPRGLSAFPPCRNPPDLWLCNGFCNPVQAGRKPVGLGGAGGALP